MAIKAKNTITLVRTDDGLPAYVHNAWSWSADGTDRFCTEYPGENLILDTLPNKLPKIENRNQISKHVTTTFDENGCLVINGMNINVPYYLAGQFGTGELLSDGFLEEIRGKRLIASADVAFDGGESEGITSPQIGISIYVWDEKGTFSNLYRRKTIDDFERLFVDAIIPDDCTNMLVAIRGFAGGDDVTWNGSTITVRELKLEISNSDTNNPTIYTPAPSEDYANAYPTYTGILTDFNPAASQNYKDYTWARTVGPGAYTYTAWADNIAGTVGFVTDEALGKNKKYRGIYNKNIDIPDRNDPAQYRWDWTPSPDELVSTIDWQAKTSQYDMALEPDTITASVTTSKSWSKFKQDEIDSKAGKADLERAEHTLTNVGDMLEATQKQVGAMQMQSDKFEVSLKETTQAVTDQGTYVYEMLNYMQFAADGLTIGQGNSPFKMKLTNEKLAFLQSGVELARFSGRELQVKTVRVEKDLFLGNHRVKADTTSGQTIIYWVGGAAE